jgi:SHS2 domain-containing protein
VGQYEFLEEIAIADCAVEIQGDDLKDLFETAAAALAEVMVDPATVPMTIERSVSLTAPALDLLLFDWLSELIYRKDRDGEIFTRTEVRMRGAGPYSLDAHMWGSRIDPERLALRADPKAVTFHQFSLRSVDGAWRARIVIDI